MRGRILRAADFLFLITKPGAEATDFSEQQIKGLPLPGDSTILVSDFTVHNSGFKKALADPKPAGSSFQISRFWFQRRPPFMGSEASTFLDSDFSILVAQIAEN